MWCAHCPYNAFGIFGFSPINKSVSTFCFLPPQQEKQYQTPFASTANTFNND